MPSDKDFNRNTKTVYFFYIFFFWNLQYKNFMKMILDDKILPNSEASIDGCALCSWLSTATTDKSKL